LTEEELVAVLDEALVSLDAVAKERVERLVDEVRALRAEREECYVAASVPAWGGPLEESAVAAIRKTLPTTGALMRRAISEIRTLSTELRALRLSDEDREALDAARKIVWSCGIPDDDTTRALALLDRLAGVRNG
jgi:hypothetical protein